MPRPLAIAALIIAPAALSAQDVVVPDSGRVALPEDYAETYVLYDRIEKPDRKIVRFMYADPESYAAAAPDEPLPEGAILIMEDHDVVLDDDAPALDSSGAMRPLDDVRQVFVMEKREGWGDAVPAEVRNGDWDYGWFLADGSRRPDANFGGCYACHAGQAAEDYTFSIMPHLRSR